MVRDSFIGCIIQVMALLWSNLAVADGKDVPAYVAARQFLDKLPQFASRQSKEIRWANSNGGAIAGLFGEPLILRWHAARTETSKAASEQAELFFRRHGRAFGLDSSDRMVATSAVADPGGDRPSWTVTLVRERSGLRVFREGAKVVIGRDGALRWLVAAISLDPIEMDGRCASVLGNQPVVQIGLWPAEMADVEPRLVPVAVLENGTVVSLVDDRVLARPDGAEIDSFDFVVTSRGVADISEVSEASACISTRT